MRETRHYATCCHAWQLRVLAASMDRHCKPYVLHVLNWDWIEPLPPNVRGTSRALFLDRHPDLAPDVLPGRPRTPIEQVCTVRWRFVCDVLEDVRSPVTLIDGDMLFWSSPDPLFRELDAVETEIAVSPHGFAPASAGLPGATHETHRQYGLYNGGWTYFTHPAPAYAMAARTKAWSYSGFLDHGSGRRTYGDQGLLELVQEQFDGHVIQHRGVNVGPWNIHRRHLTVLQHLGEDPSNVVLVDGVPLISYHYSSFRAGQFADAEYELTRAQILTLYRPYVEAMNK